MNLIRLDWDDITYAECKERISQIKEDSQVRQIRLLFSPRSGFHILVFSYFHMPIQAIWTLRRKWRDDGNRLVQDILNYPAYHRDVLFQRKGAEFEEWIVTYTRVYYNSLLWKIKSNPRNRIRNQREMTINV